jgi:hypothetical protein
MATRTRLARREPTPRDGSSYPTTEATIRDAGTGCIWRARESNSLRLSVWRLLLRFPGVDGILGVGIGVCLCLLRGALCRDRAGRPDDTARVSYVRRHRSEHPNVRPTTRDHQRRLVMAPGFSRAGICWLARANSGLVSRTSPLAGRLEPSGAAAGADATAVQTSNHEQDRETA